MRRALTCILLACLLVPACRREDGGAAVTPVPGSAAGAPDSVAPREAATANPSPDEPVAEGPMPVEGPPLPDAAAAVELPDLPDSPQERLALADKLIREMMAAYRAATYFTDRIDAVGSFGGQTTPPSTVTLAFGAGGDAHITTTSNDIVAVDGSLYFVSPTVPDRYLQFDLVDNVLTTLRKEFGSVGGVMVQGTLRYSDEPVAILGALSFGLPPTIRLSGYRVIKDLNGQLREQLSLVSVAGSTTVNVDPDTKFIVSVDVEYIDLSAPVGNFRIKRHLEFNPMAHDALPEPIVFESEGRTRVDTIAQLMGRWAPGEPVKLAVEVGEVVPDFTVHSLLGEKMTLSEMRGTPIVLGFWSNNNVRSRAGIGRLEEMYAYVTKTKEWPIRVFGVHVLGRPAAGESLWDTVWKVWEPRFFKVPCLLDDEGAIAGAFGVTVIPFWVVLDAEGRVVAAEGGFVEDSMMAVQEVLRGMMGETG